MAANDLQAELEILLNAAMQQPGVADVMRFHELTKSAEDALNDTIRAISPRTISVTSASSGEYQVESPKKVV